MRGLGLLALAALGAAALSRGASSSSSGDDVSPSPSPSPLPSGTPLEQAQARWASLLSQLRSALSEGPLPFRVIEADRSFARSDDLFQQGRSVASRLRGEKIVSNARAGESAHNWGLAVDFALDLRDAQAWRALGLDPPRSPFETSGDYGPLWNGLGQTAEALGLTWGGRFPIHDLGHVELSGWERFRPADWQDQVRAALDSEAVS